jgi:hypothetical protein
MRQLGVLLTSDATAFAAWLLEVHGDLRSRGIGVSMATDIAVSG